MIRIAACDSSVLGGGVGKENSHLQFSDNDNANKSVGTNTFPCTKTSKIPKTKQNLTTKSTGEIDANLISTYYYFGPLAYLCFICILSTGSEDLATEAIGRQSYLHKDCLQCAASHG